VRHGRFPNDATACARARRIPGEYCHADEHWQYVRFTMDNDDHHGAKAIHIRRRDLGRLPSSARRPSPQRLLNTQGAPQNDRRCSRIARKAFANSESSLASSTLQKRHASSAALSNSRARPAHRNVVEVPQRSVLERGVRTVGKGECGVRNEEALTLQFRIPHFCAEGRGQARLLVASVVAASCQLARSDSGQTTVLWRRIGRTSKAACRHGLSHFA
jgi:hypothetical protein